MYVQSISSSLSWMNFGVLLSMGDEAWIAIVQLELCFQRFSVISRCTETSQYKRCWLSSTEEHYTLPMDAVVRARPGDASRTGIRVLSSWSNGQFVPGGRVVQRVADLTDLQIRIQLHLPTTRSNVQNRCQWGPPPQPCSPLPF